MLRLLSNQYMEHFRMSLFRSSTHFGRHSIGLIGGLALAVAVVSSPVVADENTKDGTKNSTATVKTYRQRVGDVVVTTIQDGTVAIDLGLFKGVDAEELSRLRGGIAQLEGTRFPVAVNAFLVETGGRKILVDTGKGRCYGSDVGGLNDGLAALGLSAASIDAVLISHLHPDHICGLLDETGHVAFPKATVWVAKEDTDFWLSEAVWSFASEQMRPYLKRARDTLEPYRQSGQLRTFHAGDTILDHVRTIATPGHSPGHVAYLFGTQRHSVLFWGDLVHGQAIQFAHPESSVDFDADQKQAIVSRQALFSLAVAKGWLIGGAHLAFPGLGFVRSSSEAGYVWEALDPLKSSER